MKLKDFFRSVTFRCIVVLAAIAILSGAILSLLNDLLYISADEVLQRTINKIYTEETVAIAETIVDPDSDEAVAAGEYGSVGSAYRMENGQYLVEATGRGGYKGGTVTAYTAFNVENGALTGIYKVVITGNVSQSFISEMDNEYLSHYTTEKANGIVSGSEYFSTADSDYIVTGATMVANATNNAVNAGMYFLRTQVLGAGQEA